MRLPAKKIAVVLLALIGIVTLLISSISLSTRSFRYSSPEKIPSQQVGIVFGAQVRKDGSLSPVLADRVQASIELYNKGKIATILMSGDNRVANYNEVEAMKNFAVAKGVPAEAIVLDYAGLSTYDTCYRAKAIFGLEKAILITQNYH